MTPSVYESQRSQTCLCLAREYYLGENYVMKPTGENP